MAMIRVQLEISGRVQGVCYRYFTQQTAQSHGVTGWVKNRLNGDVAARLEGEEKAVNAVIKECRKGPQNAHVDDIAVQRHPYKGEFDSFAILR